MVASQVLLLKAEEGVVSAMRQAESGPGPKTAEQRATDHKRLLGAIAGAQEIGVAEAAILEAKQSAVWLEAVVELEVRLRWVRGPWWSRRQ